MPLDLQALIAQRQNDKFELFERHLNATAGRASCAILGFDVDYVRGEGPYLFDAKGDRYLDLLSGFGVFACGRNHPTVVAALDQVLHGQMAGLVAAGRVAARGPAGRAPGRAHAVARQAVLLQLRRRGGRDGDQVQPRRDRPHDASCTASTPFTA